jgi:hypothetical protein
MRAVAVMRNAHPHLLRFLSIILLLSERGLVERQSPVKIMTGLCLVFREA